MQAQVLDDLDRRRRGGASRQLAEQARREPPNFAQAKMRERVPVITPPTPDYVLVGGLSTTMPDKDQPGGVVAPRTPHRSDERQRWNEYLRGLDHDVASGRVSEAQCRRAREVWSRAVEQTPDLRHPTAGLNADGEFYFGWNYSDMPGLTLTLSFTKEGLTDWFFRDKANKIVLGSEDPVDDVPGEVFTFLRLFKQ
jgi:hypothetical protein